MSSAGGGVGVVDGGRFVFSFRLCFFYKQVTPPELGIVFPAVVLFLQTGHSYGVAIVVSGGCAFSTDN